jgi:hypothetical protein
MTDQTQPSRRGRVIVLAVVGASAVVAIVVGVLGSRESAPPTAGSTPTASSSPEPTSRLTSPRPSPERTTPGPRPTPATTSSPSPSSPRPVPTRTVRSEEPGRDGALTFTVTRVEEGGTVLGDQYGKRTAKGRFVFVRLVVENNGSEAVQFSDANQRGYDANGTMYVPDTEAAIARGGDGAYLTDLNPGTTIDGILVFDLPKGVDLTRLELHDRPDSEGVAVRL